MHICSTYRRKNLKMKKLISACLVITAFAVVPSMASAKPVLTSPTGTVAPVGTKIVGTLAPGTVTKFTTSIGTLECNTANLTGEITANSTAGGVDGTITSVVFGNTSGGTRVGEPEPECTGSGFFARGAFVTATPPFCLTATEANDIFTVRGGACTAAAAAIVFHLTVTNPLGPAFPHVNCTYQRTTLTGPMSGTFNTHPAQAGGTFTEQEFVKSAGGGECPASGRHDMSINLETEAGAAVYLSE
jgi:hypothetical protein